MTESHIFQPSWSYFHNNNNMNLVIDNARENGFFMGDDTCNPLSTMDDTYLEIMLQERCLDFPTGLDEMDITTEDDILVYFKDPISNNAESITDPSMSLEEIMSKGVLQNSQQSSFISSDASLDMTSASSSSSIVSSSLVLPTLGSEFDNELTVFHLLMAYAEAMELGQEELTQVIVKRISEKVNPVGDTVERLMYYMFHAMDKQPDYLKQESVKNFYQAFKAFYQIFPYGKFAHFASNLAILENLPNNADMIIRIFDFHIGEGIQWASLLEAIGHHRREVRLTSIKFSEDTEEYSDASPLMWKFEDTKNRLCDYARTYGLNLKMDEMELVDLVGEMKKNIQKGSSGRREFFVFNCMIGLPHMGRVRRRKDVFQFLELSQNFLQMHTERKGIMIFGDGDAWEKVKNASNYGSFLDGNMAHYQALLESIKLNFPSHLGEARTAMECLFVAPLVSSLAWAEKWEERKKYGHLELRFGLEGLKLSRECLMEAKEVVREGESLYGVRIEGDIHNEMVMDWRGIPMVKVSCWRS